MYLLKYRTDQVLHRSWNFRVKSCFKEVRHSLLKVLSHCCSSNGVVGLNLCFHNAPFCFLVVRSTVNDKAIRSTGLSVFNGLRISTMIYMLYIWLSGTEQAAVSSSSRSMHLQLRFTLFHSSAGAEKRTPTSQKELSEIFDTCLASVHIYWQKRSILIMRNEIMRKILREED